MDIGRRRAGDKMSLEELYDTIAAEVVEELKTLEEVLLMKPSQGKDPIGDVKKPIRFKQKTNKSGRERPPLPDPGKKPCGGRSVTDWTKLTNTVIECVRNMPDRRPKGGG